MGCGSSVNVSHNNREPNNNSFGATRQPMKQPPQQPPPQGVMYSPQPATHHNIPPPPYTPQPPIQEPSAPVVDEQRTNENVEIPTTTSQNNEGDSKLTREVLNEFVDLDEKIHEYEASGVEEKYMRLSLEHKNLQEALRLTQHDFDGMKQQSLNNYQQQTSVSQDAEEMQMKNREHVCQKQLVNLKIQVSTKKFALDEVKQEYEKLNDLRLKVDGLLENIFNGAYGSELEDRLELEATQLLECKQQISLSHHKWWNARQLIYYSCTQIAYSVKRWQQIQEIAPTNHEARYTVVTDTYNNLVACHQNYRRAQEYLQMNLPYWSADDDKELVNSINLIYNDVATQAGYKKAHGWYKYYYWRFALLINWIDQVINKKLVVEYRHVAKQFKEKYHELKLERLRCIKEKVREVLGDDLDVNNLASETTNQEADELPSVSSDIGFTLPETFAQESGTNTEGIPEMIDTGTDPTSVEAVVNEIHKSEEASPQTANNSTGEVGIGTDSQTVADASVGVGNSDDSGFGTEQSVTETGVGTDTITQESGILTDMAVGQDASIGTETVTSGDMGVGTDAAIGTDMSVGTDTDIGTDMRVGTEHGVGTDMGVGTEHGVGTDMAVGTEHGVGTDMGVGTDNDEHKPPVIRHVPLEELAPTPSDNELFGDITKLREKHAQELSELNKVQEKSKNSQETNLQEKLRRRQSRRRKLLLHEAQREEIASRLSGRIEEEGELAN